MSSSTTNSSSTESNTNTDHKDINATTEMTTSKNNGIMELSRSNPNTISASTAITEKNKTVNKKESDEKEKMAYKITKTCKKSRSAISWTQPASSLTDITQRERTRFLSSSTTSPSSDKAEAYQQGNQKQPKHKDKKKRGLDNKVWEVHKFGGTSVASSSCFVRVAQIIEQKVGITTAHNANTLLHQINHDDDDENENENGSNNKRHHNLGIVVSAMGGKPKVTDLLLNAVNAASQRQHDQVTHYLNLVQDKHFTCIDSLHLPPSSSSSSSSDHNEPDDTPEKGERKSSTELKADIQKDIQDIKDILRTVSLLKWNADRILDLVAGYGETWSAKILCALLSHRAYLREEEQLKQEMEQKNKQHQEKQKKKDKDKSSEVVMNQQQQQQDDDGKEEKVNPQEKQDTKQENNKQKEKEKMRVRSNSSLSSMSTTSSSSSSISSSSQQNEPKIHHHCKSKRKSPAQKKLTTPTFIYLDARKVITVNEETLSSKKSSPIVVWDTSLEKLYNVYHNSLSPLKNKKNVHFVITGFVATNTSNVPTTLQRDGSDYSAAIFGRLFQSVGITIWTDVNGVMSADPRLVPSSYPIPDVSFSEAMELAYFGAKVMHPKTMLPALQQPPIPIYIRNTFNPVFPGTRIYTSSSTHVDRDKCVCGFSSIEGMALVNVEGSGMVGIPGVARRLFGTLEHYQVNVVLISQASSEHSITFATTIEQADVAKKGIEEEFSREIQNNHISTVDIQKPCSIIAAVGDGMPTTTGVSGRFFSALGDAKITVLAISQGSSARNISAVVYTAESTRALRAVHAAFRLSHTSIRVGVIGMNDVGLSLLKLLEGQRNKLRLTFEIDLRVCALMKDGGSESIVILNEEESKATSTNNDDDVTRDSITMEAYNALKEKTTKVGRETNNDGENNSTKCIPGDLSTLPTHVLSPDCAHNVIFDCTGEVAVGQYHAEWLGSGVNVITANSTGLAGSIEQRAAIDAVINQQQGRNVSYLREVTVGGALPVVRTLYDLLHSGDRIHFVDGILSVSMSYILYRIAPPPGAIECSDFDEESSNGAFQCNSSMSPSKEKIYEPCLFSEAVKEAVALGLMETDPRRDFSNEYTARVLMVLAKELGGLDKFYDVEKIQASSDQLFLDDDGPCEKADEEESNFENSKTEEEKEDTEWKDELYTKLNAKMKERVDSAARKGCVPRHVSSIDVKAGTIEVKIVDVPMNHVFAITPPSCEIVRFFTERHRSYPLIIQGPSAGADSTASALLAELVNLMRNKVGAKSGTISRSASAVLAGK